VLFLSNAIGFNATFPFVCGSILLVTVGVSLWLREPKRTKAVAGDQQVTARVAREVMAYVVTAGKAIFGSRRSIAGLVFALLPAGAYALSSALQSNLAVELGLSDNKIASLNLVSTVLAAIGCVVGGWLSDKIGRRKSTGIYVVLTAIPTALLAWYMQREGWIMPVDMDAPGRPVASGGLIGAFWGACAVHSLFFGLIYGSRSALFMDMSNPLVGATQFTAYMALMNVVISYTAWWQGYAIERFGYPTTLLIDSCFGLLCIAVLPLMGAPRPLEAEPVEPSPSAFDPAGGT
jgi:predicted MFS family arabinose efflux permease